MKETPLLSVPVTLVQLVNFSKLAEVKHFTEASRRLHVAQPTLSASIRSLERALGVALVDHGNTRTVTLTPEGERFAAEIRPHLAGLAEVINEVERGNKPGGRALEIGTIPTAQGEFIPRFLHAYYDECGYDAQVRISVGFSTDLIRGLKEQLYDIIVCAYTPEEKDLVFVPVMTTSLVVVASKRSSFATLDEFDLSALNEVPYVTYDPSTPIGTDVRNLLDERGVRVRPVEVLGDEYSLGALCVYRPSVVGLMTDTYELDSFRDKVKVLPIKGVPTGWHKICVAYSRHFLLDKSSSLAIRVAKRDLMGVNG